MEQITSIQSPTMDLPFQLILPTKYSISWRMLWSEKDGNSTMTIYSVRYVSKLLDTIKTFFKTGLVTPIYLENVDGKVINKDILCLALDFGHEDVIKYLFREFHTSSFYTFTDQCSQHVPKAQTALKHHKESHEAIQKFYPHYQFALEYFLHELEVLQLI